MRYFLRSTSLIQCLDVIVSIFKGVFNSLMFPSDQLQNLPMHLLQTQILWTKLTFQYLMNQSNMFDGMFRLSDLYLRHDHR
jgi:hypothetical protein